MSEKRKRRKRFLHRMKNWYRDLSMTSKISTVFLTMLIPMVILMGMWFFNVLKFNGYYSNSVKNTYTISEFNLDFKTNYDYKIYLIVAGNKTYTYQNPEADIEQARRILATVGRDTKNKESLKRVQDTEQNLDSLEKYTLMIRDNVIEGGKYDENREIWETGVQAITSMIQQNILEILYYENKESAMVYERIQKMTLQMVIISSVILVIFIGVAVLMATYIPKTITRPVNQLIKVTEQAANGDLTVRADVKYGAELKVLGDSFNTMIEHMVLLIERVKEEQTNLREAELEILQMQINPHFLYNTLDTIVWLAEADDKEAVVNMVETLSEFFRSSLNGGKDIVSIVEETRHIASYLQIQKVRYQDILEYGIQIPKELEDYEIPKITLQPLVENALYHGIKNKRGRGKIRVFGYEEGGEGVLVVEDDGIGMKKERLLQVQRGLTCKEGDEKDFYGLYNVNERIRLKFGDKYGLKIDSKYGQGTRVEVHLPKKVQENVKKLTQS